MSTPRARLALAGGFDGTDGGYGFEMTGEVRWWDPIEGSGCIRAGHVRVFLHARAVREFGRPNIPAGARVTFVAEHLSPTLAVVLRLLDVDTST